MLRASKTLLCVLAADVCLASRQTGTVTNVIDSIDSLLSIDSANRAVHSQVMSNLRLLASNTTGVSTSLKTALQNMITSIENDVEQKIKDSFAGLQSAIEDKLTHLGNADGIKTGFKTKADTADTDWFTCVRQEKSLRSDIEDVQAKLEQSRTNQEEPCQTQSDLMHFEAAPTLSGFTCDISVNGNCNQQVENFGIQANDMLKGVKADLSKTQERYTTAANACDAAKNDETRKQSLKDETQNTYRKKRADCVDLHEARQLDMCSYGTSLQQTCTESKQYVDLIAEVDAVNGGEHSLSDMQQEFRTTSITKCICNKVIEGLNVDAATVEACYNPEMFESEVGKLDKKETEYETLIGDGQGICHGTDTSITFTGQTFNVPAGEYPPSKDYTLSPFNPDISVSEGSSPFSWCRGPTPGK